MSTVREYEFMERRAGIYDALREILKSGKDNLVSHGAARNISCPPEVLAEIIKTTTFDDIRWFASHNSAHEKYLRKIKRDEKKIKLQEERLNSSVRSNVNGLFYGIQVNDDR